MNAAAGRGSVPLILAATRQAVALLAAATLVGCERSTSQPTAPPAATTRAVAAVVTDSTGAPEKVVLVTAIRLDQAAESPFVYTDTAGVARFALADGRWCLSALVPQAGEPLVAGRAGEVRAGPLGGVDSVLFRLVVLPSSHARGRILLSGQTTHAGTFVRPVELPNGVATAADGSYDVHDLPPGTWTGLATHLGYQSKLFDIVVPFPGDTVAVATVTLLPAPLMLARQ